MQKSPPVRFPRRSAQPNYIPVENEIAAPEKAALAMTDKVIVERYAAVSGVEIPAITALTPFVIAEHGNLVFSYFCKILIGKK